MSTSPSRVVPRAQSQASSSTTSSPKPKATTAIPAPPACNAGSPLVHFGPQTSLTGNLSFLGRTSSTTAPRGSVASERTNAVKATAQLFGSVLSPERNDDAAREKASAAQRERALQQFTRLREAYEKGVRTGARRRGSQLPWAADSDVAAFARTMRKVVSDADGVKAPSEATSDFMEDSSSTSSGDADDWRDDDNLVDDPSVFFSSPQYEEQCNNRVMDSIIAKGKVAQTDEDLAWVFRQTTFLTCLTPEETDEVIAATLRREYTAGETIMDCWSSPQHVYVVLWGSVEVFQLSSLNESGVLETGCGRPPMSRPGCGDRQSRARSHLNNGAHNDDVPELILDDTVMPEKGPIAEDDILFTHAATLLPGQVFGTESCVFDEKNKFTFRAGAETRKTVMALLPFDSIRTMLERNARFAQAVGASITGSVDVFGPVRELCRYVFSADASQNEYLPLWSIVESYSKINNVIHTKIYSKEVDVGSWGYALNRLPQNVTSTFCFDLVHALPPFVATRMRNEARYADVRKQMYDESSLSQSRTAITYVRTKERRRCTWHLGMEGKTLVLLRDGFTDLLDFLSMLCVHIIESSKLRGRVQGMVHPPAVDLLGDYLERAEQERQENKQASPEEDVRRIKTLLARLPLSKVEQEGLLRNWGRHTITRIYEIIMHREEYNVRVDPSISRKFQINPFHEWALNLRACILAKLGLDRSQALPADVAIDVVSSNTHCIKNLLCSFNRTFREEALAYIAANQRDKLGEKAEWHNADDMLYVGMNAFLQKARPDLKDAYQESLEGNGMTVLQDTAMTGLQVDVIPVHLLDFNTIDETIRTALEAHLESTTEGKLKWEVASKPLGHVGSVSMPLSGVATPTGSRGPSQRRAVPASQARTSVSHAKAAPADDVSAFRLRRHFIINMDFAFGAQAEGICRSLFSAFGKNIRSVSVMGKAGGLQGKRGDIQLASHVLLSKSSLIVEDNQDELRNCRNQDLSKARLEELAGPNVAVHHGKVLTVTGTMLQNAPLLRYYQRIWRCVGTEMEGSYFARVIEDFYRQGVANQDLKTRFAYYTSDLPLAASDAQAEEERTHKVVETETLSAPMTPQEGVPPLYAIARGIIEQILIA